MRIYLMGAALAATLLAGCSTAGLKRMDAVHASQLADARTQAGTLAATEEGFIRDVPEIWVGDASVPVTAETTKEQPKALDAHVSFRRQYPVSLQMVAEWISTNGGIEVTVAADAIKHAAETVIDPTRALVERSDTGAPQTKGDGAFFLQYSGSLRGLLDEVAARTGNSWVWRNNRATLLHADTRTFAIHALPGQSSVEATVSNQTSSGAQQSGSGDSAMTATQSAVESGQTTTVKTQIETYDAITKTVQAMLSPVGKVFASSSTSSLTVTDVPAVLDRIGDYVEMLNGQLTRQVVIDVRVYSVDVTDTESYGIDWKMVWESVSGSYRAVTNFASGPVNAGANSLNLSVIDNANQWGGSQVLFQALSAQGTVSIKNSAAVVTLSNQPAPVQIAEETTYLAESSTQLVSDAGATTTLKGGKVVTGFSMNVMPVVLDSNEVLMQLQMNLSTLRGIRQIASGGQLIEAPQIDARQFLQRVKLHSGSTLVLSGFEQDRVNGDIQGIGKPTFSLAGGSRNGVRKQTVLVVTLTPKVIN